MKDIKLRFGKYKGKMLKDVPNDYLRWAISANALKGRALLYAKIKTGYPKDKWKVTVEDSIGGDGEYFVDAYSFDDAIRQCQRQYRIQSTQSYHGTSFSAVNCT